MPIAVNARFLSQHVTGTQRFAINISRELKKIKPDTIFLAPPDIRKQDLAEELDVTVIGEKHFHIYNKLKLPAHLLWEQIDLPRWLKKHKHLPLLNLVNLAPLSYPENHVAIHDLAFRLYPQYYSKKFRFFYNFAVPIIARRAKHIITVSHFSKQTIEKHLNIPSSKITVAHNAIEIEHWQSYAIKPKPYPWPYILTVGSLEPRKNMVRLIAAFNQIIDKNLHLVIAGRGNSKIFGKTSKSKQKKIIFTGYLNDEKLANLYANAVCLCYPSLYEGFGLPPLEAQALGCPVIVSNQTSLPEVFLDSALYCNPNKVESIVDKLIEMTGNENLRQKLVAAGYRNIKRFSWKKSVSLILDSMSCKSQAPSGQLSLLGKR